MLDKGNLSCEQDIRNIEGKLAKETYKKCENDVENVYMWGQENPNVLFFLSREGTFTKIVAI